MAFANLFRKLSAVDEDVKSPGQPAFTHRNVTVFGKRGIARKRKTGGEQPGSYKKKTCYQTQTTTTYDALKDDNTEATHRYHLQSTNHEHTLVGSAKEMKNNHKAKAGHSSRHGKGQNHKAKTKKQQQETKTEGQKNQHQRSDRRRHANGDRRAWLRKGGGGCKWNDAQQDIKVKPRFMTQEFKDQNALLVDGRLLCRHFLWGRCIKGDDCQLEHAQGYNNLLKEVCKFYVQGLCTKGESCPYMHKSFPCKFFHRKGKCSQGADCRFSHEPLNNVTEQLLEAALKRENDLYELAKKGEEESSGQPANTDESDVMEANRTPDILIQPLRPFFYNSTETNAEKETLCQTEELTDITDEGVPPCASDATQPPLTKPNHEEPVCYSVEAVLGPLSRPFTGLFTTPGSQESISLSVPQTASDATLGSANQNEAPYSVDAVLRSCKSVENSTFGQMFIPPTEKTVSYCPKTDSEEITDPLLSAQHQNEKVSLNARIEANNTQEKMFKSLSSLRVNTGLSSKTFPDLSLTSGDHKKQSGGMPEVLKTAHRASHEVQLELLYPAVTEAEKSTSSKSKGDTKESTHLHTDVMCPTTHKSQTCPPKHPIQLKPHLSGLAFDSQSSKKPFSFSLGFTEFKGRAAVPVEPVASSSTKTSDSANSARHHFAAKQSTEILQHSKETQSDLKLGTQQHYSTKISPDCSSKIANCDISVGCNKKITVYNVLKNPITNSVTPKPARPQGFVHLPQSVDFSSKDRHVKTAVEPGKSRSTSFLSLFATPLSETAASLPCLQSQGDHSENPPCSQHSGDNAFHVSDSKQRASDLESPLPCKVTADVTLTSHRPTSKFSSPRNENDPVTQVSEQLVNPVCSLGSDSLSETPTRPAPCGPSPSMTQAPQQLPDISSSKGSAEDSVLKTLFLCLSPYQEEGEQQGSIQISVPPERERETKSSKGCVSVKQQQKGEKKRRRKKKLMTQGSHKQPTDTAAAYCTEYQPSLQTPQIPSEATGGSTLSSPSVTEPQVRNCGAHSFPFKPVTPLMQRHTRPTLALVSEEGKSLTGSLAVTPLKDLFKTLDTTVFHFGH